MNKKYFINKLYIKNFKCFDNSKFYEFAFKQDANLIILSGPNGFGKTTFFDAIELFFRKKLTRFHNDIEGKKRYDNLLINNINHNGYLFLELKNSNDKTDIARFLIIINNKKTPLKETMKAITLYQCLPEFKLEEVSEDSQYLNEISSIEEILETNIENFNIFYYISQAESTHFLKRKIDDRKNIMDSLLGIESISQKLQCIEDKLIGKQRNSNVGIKSKISTEEKNIAELKENLDFIIKNKKTLKNVMYRPIFSKPIHENINGLFWDKETFDLDKYEIQEIFNIIDNIFYAINNFEDYDIHMQNKKITEYTKAQNTLSHYILIQEILPVQHLDAFLSFHHLISNMQMA